MTIENKNTQKEPATKALSDPACSRMDVPTALSVADKYSKPSSGIGCIHSEAYETLARRVRLLESELRNIANAKPSKWGDMSDQFQSWAQNRARAILSENAQDDSRDLSR